MADRGYSILERLERGADRISANSSRTIGVAFASLLHHSLQAGHEHHHVASDVQGPVP